MKKIKVLYLSANPADTQALNLEREIREITKKIQAADYRDAIELQSMWAVRPDDLLEGLNRHRPEIVHFSGHGISSGEILLVDSRDRPKPVSPAALRALFRTLRGNIRLVVLNACYSRVQAEAVVGEIDCVVGMSDAIETEAATLFAASFYRAIGFGHSIQAAFDQGRVALLLEELDEENVPVLLVKEGVDAASIVLVGGPETQVPASGGEREARAGDGAQDPAPDRGHVVYDSRRDTEQDVSEWTTYSSVGGIYRRIRIARLAPGEGPTFELEALGDEFVGINRSFRTLHGRAEFEYKIEYARAAPNLFVYMIPMEETGIGRYGLIEVGTDDQDDPRNVYSPYRQRFLIPVKHYGDGQWHRGRLDFDFQETPRAFYSILAPRINEGAPNRGAAKLLVRNVQVYV